ncbi:MAG: hypothetical protein CMI24_05395 [Opitutae bacterium]|nr:hypothetical protein [Opitutae bacterium]
MTVYPKIESTSNPKIKHLVRLRKSSRYRNEIGMFILEGRREIEAMLAAGRKLEEIYLTSSFLDQNKLSLMLPDLSKDIQVFELSEKPMSKISYRSHGSEIIGVAKTWDLGLTQPEFSDHGLVLILDEIEKPGNLGAILRTSEAMGVDAVLLSDASVDFFNPNVVRSSMGLFASMPVFSGTKQDVLGLLRQSNLSVVCTSSKASKSIYEYDFDPRVALVMGGESKGLGSFWEKNTDSMISIPMIGKASSLNLNCATACALMEINRRKMPSSIS